MKMNFSDEFNVEVFHAEENQVEKNIQTVPELKSALNTFRLRELGEKILERTGAKERHRLKTGSRKQEKKDYAAIFQQRVKVQQRRCPEGIFREEALSN